MISFRKRDPIRIRTLSDAHVELICGCMFSGKTTELIGRMVQLQNWGMKIVCVKPMIDNRYSDRDIVTHNGLTLPAHAISSEEQILELAEFADAVGMDEVHFLGDSLLRVCRQLTERGKWVVCCGLDRDMWGDAFTHIRGLRSSATTTELWTRCSKCGGPANRTHRKVPLLDDHLIGGPESFEARCVKCFCPPARGKPPHHVPGLAP